MSNPPHVDVFSPAEGAVLDLASLQSVADAHDRILHTFLQVASPGSTGLVLSGLELKGDWASVGPPGTVRPDARSEGLEVSPGAAILTGRNGVRYLAEIKETLHAKWPTKAGPAVQGMLVMLPEPVPETVASPVAVARERVRLVLGFVKPSDDAAFLLPLASSLGNGRDWVTDLNRIWQPEHQAIQGLLKRFEALERLVWRAEPEGSVWDRQVLGRNWVRYQTMAAAALQAARMTIQAKSSTTTDRVRVLNALFEQLHISVERAATELLQIVGAEEGAGPYLKVGAKTLQEGG